MPDEDANKSNDKGKEVVDDSKKPDEPDKVIKEPDKTPTLLQEAKEINAERRLILEEEKTLQDRKEKFAAEELVGGRAKVGKPQTPEEKLKEEADARVQRIGEASGAQWAKKKD